MVKINERKKSFLVLATGRVFQGYAFGASTEEQSGEVVFNTSMTGYQEILTDPSYKGQIVVMTASHIGNTGINDLDEESRKVFLSGFVIQELSQIVSNWRSQKSLSDYLKEAGVPGIYGVDTRALTRHLRSLGAVNGIITTNENDMESIKKKAANLPSLEGQDLVKFVSTEKPYPWKDGSGIWKEKNLLGDKNKKKSKQSNHVVVLDYGVKQNILRCLADRNCNVTVVPSTTSAQDVMALKPDGIMVSNGPGDPAMVEYGIKTLKDLIAVSQEQKKKGEKPLSIFGICLGHQMLGIALGGKTFKLKFGHHGANHPIKDLTTGQVEITTQNHGFSVEGEKSKDGWFIKGNKEAEVTHINLNDKSVEGFQHKKLPVFAVQYHPEASGGPHDARHLFTRFIESMNSEKN